jgi:replicative DNA helicase
MQATDLIVLGGRTSMGKSAMASDIALNVATQGRGVIEINGEMSVQQMTRRHLTSLAFTKHGKGAPSYSAIRKRMVSREQRQMLGQAKAEFDQLPISLLQRPGLGFGALRSLVRRERAKMAREGVKLGLLIVDHAGLIKADGGGRSRYEDQTAVSNGMKELAHELGIPVMALAQLSRETEKRDNKRPALSDLRDSGAWEQDADVVIGVYRDAYYAAREPEPKDDGKPNSSSTWAEWDRRRRSKTIEAIILKAREGECTTVELWGDMATNAIRAREPDNGGFL